MSDRIQLGLQLDSKTREEFDALADRTGQSLVDTFRRAVSALSAMLDIADSEMEDITEQFGPDAARIYRRIGLELGHEVFINTKIAAVESEDGRAGIALEDTHQFYESHDGKRLLASKRVGGTVEVYEAKKGRLQLLTLIPGAPPALN